jgi:hypothetical protein
VASAVTQVRVTVTGAPETCPAHVEEGHVRPRGSRFGVWHTLGRMLVERLNGKGETDGIQVLGCLSDTALDRV